MNIYIYFDGSSVSTADEFNSRDLIRGGVPDAGITGA